MILLQNRPVLKKASEVVSKPAGRCSEPMAEIKISRRAMSVSSASGVSGGGSVVVTRISVR